MPRLAAGQGLSSQQPRYYRIATSSPRLQTPPAQLVLLKWGIYFSHWFGGKFSFYRASARQRRETELCGHCPFFFLSRKLQSSLLFEGNYFYELVISSEDDSTQISPESSCMKQPEDPNQKKNVGEERWWSLNPENNLHPRGPGGGSYTTSSVLMAFISWNADSRTNINEHIHPRAAAESGREMPLPTSEDPSHKTREVQECQLWI